MTKTLPLITACLFVFSTHAQQGGMQLSRDQFVKMYETMIENAESFDTGKMMREQLSAEDYEQYRADEEAYQQETDQQMAECLGISSKELAQTKQAVTPKTTVKFIKQCANELPDTIQLSGFDMTQDPSLAAFNQCIQTEVSAISNVSLEKYQQCQQELGLDDDS